MSVSFVARIRIICIPYLYHLYGNSVSSVLPVFVSSTTPAICTPSACTIHRICIPWFVSSYHLWPVSVSCICICIRPGHLRHLYHLTIWYHLYYFVFVISSVSYHRHSLKRHEKRVHKDTDNLSR
jgi:hypothetical protein